MLSFLRRRRVGSVDRSELGAAGERTAKQYLERRGFRILAANFRCPAGELDLIAMDGDVLVFIEVRTRRDDTDIDPSDRTSRFRRGAKLSRA